MLGFESRSMQKKFFFSLKFSKFMPVLLVGTGAGAVDTAKKNNNFFPLRLCRLAGQCKRLGGIKYAIFLQSICKTLLSSVLGIHNEVVEFGICSYCKTTKAETGLSGEVCCRFLAQPSRDLTALHSSSI